MRRTLPQLAELVLAEVCIKTVTIGDLCKKLVEPRRKVERAVELLRDHGHPVMSMVKHPWGLKLARSSEEFKPFVAQIYHRQATMFDHLRKMQKSLNVMEQAEGKQLSFLDELKGAA